LRVFACRACPWARPVASTRPEPKPRAPSTRTILLQAWRDLFSYRRVDPTRSRLVTQEEESLRRQQLELQLFAARIAAMQQDRPGYAQALRSALELLDRSFDSRDPAVSAARIELAGLAAIDVDPAAPEIGTAAQLLQRVIRASSPAKP
jgi:uncharacterized protein HemX